MALYLDPKADLTFKKVFGTHPDLLISLLNALLPLDDDGQIESIEYLPVELIPENPLRKDTIVDVRCRDVLGRQFVVEMQMVWTTAFMQRVLFNASKAYVSQAEMGCHYSDLQPVYSLNLINEIFEKDVPEYRHDYRIVHDRYSKKVIKGLHFTFLELPKFTPHTISEKRMAVLWLRFLTEINAKTHDVPGELLDSPEINRALEALRVSAFSEAELRAYDKFWDVVSTERTLIVGSYADGMAEGIEKGKAEGIAEGIEKGKAEGIAEGIEKGKAEGIAEGIEKGKAEGIEQTARKMLELGVSVDIVMHSTGLSADDIDKLNQV